MKAALGDVYLPSAHPVQTLLTAPKHMLHSRKRVSYGILASRAAQVANKKARMFPYPRLEALRSP